MRSDMAKVIVERPRVRLPKRDGSWYPRGSLKNVFQRDWELAPKREGMGHAYGEKWLNENLQPLVRYLRSNVGRPWDKVRSEIAAHVRCTSAVQKHVLDHLADFVEEHPQLEGRVVLDRRYRPPRPLVSWGMRLRFWVCPRTGLLRLAPVVARKRHKPPVDPDRRILSPKSELRRLGGVWYECELVPKGEREAGAIVSKRQLGSREIASRGLRPD